MNKKIISCIQMFLVSVVLIGPISIIQAQDNPSSTDMNSIQREVGTLFEEMNAILSARAKEFETIQEQFRAENAAKFSELETLGSSLAAENQVLNVQIEALNSKGSDFEARCAKPSSPDVQAKCLEDQAVLIRQGADIETRTKTLEGKIEKFNTDQKILQNELARRYVTYVESLRTLKKRMEQTIP